MPRTYQRMTPLTPNEKDFAERNHAAIYWSLRILGYDEEENYDIAVMGYLKAVKNWFEREDLHKYSFKTIVKWCVKTSLSNEKRKKDRRIKAISLNAPVADGEDLTYQDVITYDNYLNQYIC